MVLQKHCVPCKLPIFQLVSAAKQALLMQFAQMAELKSKKKTFWSLGKGKSWIGRKQFIPQAQIFP